MRPLAAHQAERAEEHAAGEHLQRGRAEDVILACEPPRIRRPDRPSERRDLQQHDAEQEVPAVGRAHATAPARPAPRFPRNRPAGPTSVRAPQPFAAAADALRRRPSRTARWPPAPRPARSAPTAPRRRRRRCRRTAAGIPSARCRPSASAGGSGSPAQREGRPSGAPPRSASAAPPSAPGGIVSSVMRMPR